jgi:hypothetical protein
MSGRLENARKSRCAKQKVQTRLEPEPSVREGAPPLAPRLKKGKERRCARFEERLEGHVVGCRVGLGRDEAGSAVDVEFVAVASGMARKKGRCAAEAEGLYPP